tara:strand:+ start:466 stop:642 length:177 start_codon:yes stop_codon:yes gene_type:complete
MGEAGGAERCTGGKTADDGSYRGETAFRAGFSKVSTTCRARWPKFEHSIEKLMGQMQF